MIGVEILEQNGITDFGYFDNVLIKRESEDGSVSVEKYWIGDEIIESGLMSEIDLDNGDIIKQSISINKISFVGTI